MNVYSISLKGLREQNEDQEVIEINKDGIKNPDLNKINLFAIFDGHGGKEVSTYLKKNLPKFFLDKRIIYPLSKNYVYGVYDHLQQDIIKENIGQFCGSTACVVINFEFEGKTYLNILNTGDSRCILCRDNFAIPLTKDHKPNWPEETHRIMKLGGKPRFDGHDWRIKDLSVSRSFGDIDATPFLNHLPDIFKYTLEPKCDKFIVIGCDGLFDVNSNQDIVNYILLNCYDNTTKKRINKNVNIAQKLAEYAIKRGSTDNVSVIIVFFD